MKYILLGMALLWRNHPSPTWGFYAHQKINHYAVFLLPPKMLALYKPHIDFLAAHSTDPDKRRYAVTGEAPRHYIDLDHYGSWPYDSLPRSWNAAVARYSEDTLQAHGIVPWHIQAMLGRLTKAFQDKNLTAILKYSAEIGHYISDAHVPLHACSNHNGQKTNQHGIHGFWESRVPELLAEPGFDFFIGHAQYLNQPATYIWSRVLESAAAADSVLRIERELSERFPGDQKYAFENRNGRIVRQYAAEYTIAYHTALGGMVERRMRLAIFSVASFWLTAWVNAGQPDLSDLLNRQPDPGTLKILDTLHRTWQGKSIKELNCE
jgi:hypothetical protein